jgi:hypothetical protein
MNGLRDDKPAWDLPQGVEPRLKEIEWVQDVTSGLQIGCTSIRTQPFTATMRMLMVSTYLTVPYRSTKTPNASYLKNRNKQHKNSKTTQIIIPTDLPISMPYYLDSTAG